MDNQRLIMTVVITGLVVVLVAVAIPLATGKLGCSDKGKGETGKGAQAGWEENDPKAGEVEGTETVTIGSKFFGATFTTRGAAVVSWHLSDPRYEKQIGKGKDKHTVPVDLVSLSPAGRVMPLLTLSARWDDRSFGGDLEYEVTEKDARHALFTATTRSWKVERIYELVEDKPYQMQVVAKLTNLTQAAVGVRPRLAVRMYREIKKSSGLLSMFKPVQERSTGMCMLDGDLERKDLAKVQGKGGFDRLGKVDWLAVDDLYFLAAIMPSKMETSGGDDGNELKCVVAPDASGGLRAELDFGKRHVAPGASITLPTRVYMGPKEYETLQAAGPGLGKSIDYGWFGGLSRFLYVVLRTFHSFLHNWALAIILLTVVVKLVLMPLTHWSFKSMQQMQTIKPLIDDLNRQYPEAEDKDKKNAALMNLYRTHKINPLMGCMPMLLQMPIWIALYRMLAQSVELYHTPLILWIDDMSQADPYFILPVVLGAVMFVQQKLTPSTADNQQAKIMLYMMPPMFTLFMLFLPAGLNLYILVNSVLSIAQQKLLYRPKVASAQSSSVRLISELEPGQLQSERKSRRSEELEQRKKSDKGRKNR